MTRLRSEEWDQEIHSMAETHYCPKCGGEIATVFSPGAAGSVPSDTAHRPSPTIKRSSEPCACAGPITQKPGSGFSSDPLSNTRGT